ncbi:MAG: CPBP family intramembrane metalloprotease [Deltaproteobacteria bacterium]|nr:CPBP family intramembrane metalloprotease [Deltaproteobacteria bacterium]
MKRGAGEAGPGGAREGHGWWPYLGPYGAFLLVVEFSGRLPEEMAPWMLLVKPAVPAAMMIYFASRGAYPELRGLRFQASHTLLDVLLGVALAVLWMGPYLLIDALPRPDAADGFDSAQAGESLIALVLGARLVGYAVVTPFFEELFIRSFVMRYAEAYNRALDFRDLPLARYTLRSFSVTVVVFTLGHAPWEWWVAVPWVAITSLWFYWRRDMSSVIVVHAVTNASILVYVAARTGGLVPSTGHPLWIFV